MSKAIFILSFLLLTNTCHGLEETIKPCDQATETERHCLQKKPDAYAPGGKKEPSTERESIIQNPIFKERSSETRFPEPDSETKSTGLETRKMPSERKPGKEEPLPLTETPRKIIGTEPDVKSMPSSSSN